MDESMYKCYCSTNIHAARLYCEWKVYNFKVNGKGVGECLTSPEFSHPDENIAWRILLYPSGYRDDYKDFLSVGLRLVKSTLELETHYEFYILNNNKEKCFNYKNSRKLKKGGGLYMKRFLKKSSIVTATHLPNDCLTIICEITAGLNNVTSHIETDFISNQNIQFHLLHNYKTLFNNQELCDVTIIVSRKKFYAHKAILAAHSPVFLAMFKNTAMKENVENEIKINDIDFNTVQELLRFIYSGEIQNIDTLINGLLIAADKYDIKSLLIKCEKYLESKLSVDNVTSIVSLADNYNAPNLRKTAINFFMVHKKMLKIDVCKFLKTLKRHTVEEIANSLIVY